MLNSYLKLKTEAGYDGLGAKEIEVKKLGRMFEDVGGMKNMRRFVKEKRILFGSLLIKWQNYFNVIEV